MPWDDEDDAVSYPNKRSPVVFFQESDAQSNTANDLVSSLIISRNCLEPQHAVKEATSYIEIEELCNLDNSATHHDTPETHSKELPKAGIAVVDQEVDCLGNV